MVSNSPIFIAIFSIVFCGFSARAAEPSGKTNVDGSLSKIRWGQELAGTSLRAPDSLKGKVVLLKIWGG